MPVGAGALLRLRVGEAAQNTPGRIRPAESSGLWGGTGDPSSEVSGEAARVRIMVRYIRERHLPGLSAGFTRGAHPARRFTGH